MKNIVEGFKNNKVNVVFNILIYMILVIGLFNHEFEKYCVIALGVVCVISYVLLDQQRRMEL